MKMWWTRAAFLLTSFLAAPCYAYTVISPENPEMLGWDTTTLTVNLNDRDCPRGMDMPGLVNQALGLWNQALVGKLTLRLGNISGTNAVDAVSNSAVDAPVVICDPQFVEHTRSDGNTTPGQTGVLLDTGVNHLTYAYTLLNVETATLANIENIPQGRVVAIIAHEIGHVLGLGHSPNPEALMYYDVSNKQRARLSQDDIDGAIALYTPRPGRDDSPLGCGRLENGSGEGPSDPRLPEFFLAALLVCAGTLRLRRSRFSARSSR